ncbi:MAG: hypothetical protein U0903_02715 [Planctomycetales bacterium]
MKSAALSVVVCLLAVGVVRGDEKKKVVPATLPSAAVPANSVAKPAVPLTAGSLSLTARRKAVESKLQTPANLDFGDRKQASVKEILEQLHAKHQLSIRMDVTTFAWMMGPDVAVAHQPKSKGNNDEGSSTPAPVVTSVPPAITIAPVAASAPAAAPPAAPAAVAPVVVPAIPAAAAPAVSVAPPATAPVTAPTTAPGSAPATAPAAEKPAETKPAAPKEAKEDDDSEEVAPLKQLLEMEVDLEYMNVKEGSIESVLQLALGSLPQTFGEDEGGMPIAYTQGLAFDFLVEENGVVITTRTQALAQKETRVYSVKHLKEIKPEQLAELIRKSIRPWSWRSQINDFGDQLKGVAVPTGMLKSLAESGLQSAVSDLGVVITTADGTSKPATPPTSPDAAKTESSTINAKEMALMGNAMANLTVALGHASLSMLEMFHYAELPTGTIQTLPGRLVITQSQATHREIADLIRQLGEE